MDRPQYCITSTVADSISQRRGTSSHHIRAMAMGSQLSNTGMATCFFFLMVVLSGFLTSAQTTFSRDWIPGKRSHLSGESSCGGFDPEVASQIQNLVEKEESRLISCKVMKVVSLLRCTHYKGKQPTEGILMLPSSATSVVGGDEDERNYFANSLPKHQQSPSDFSSS